MSIPPKKSTPPPAPAPAAASAFQPSFVKVKPVEGSRTVLYGTGGIGKTTLCTKMPGRTVFIDRDKSLGKLSNIPDSVMVAECNGWTDVRATLQSKLIWTGIKNIVLDSGSTLEADCIAHMLRTHKTESGQQAKTIEDYGWGKGYRLLFDTFMLLLSDLDAHFSAGRNIVLICHDTTSMVPNPEGEDWLRYEPLLYQSDKVSVRAKVKNWADYVLFYGYDVLVKDGVGKGAGTRTIYPSERPHCMAKSRAVDAQDPIPIDADTDLWSLFGIV